MTGGEHYREAERLLEQAANAPRGVIRLPDGTSAEDGQAIRDRIEARGWDLDLAYATESIQVDLTPLLLAAQAHATLALASATDPKADQG